MEKFAENISKHIGLPWNGLIDQYRKIKKDEPPDPGRVKSSSSSSSSSTSTTRLQKGDASVFGYRPSLDGCCLTLCGQCGAVIKPQALLSHIERRHCDANDDTSVQHLAIQKPTTKLMGSSKSKAKNSPRNSPKLTLETNVLDKYKLPKPSSNKNAGPKVVHSTVDRANSALVKHLNLAVSQPVVALNYVIPQLTEGVETSPTNTNTSACNDSGDSCISTPKSSTNNTSSILTNASSHKKVSKRSLDSSLSEIAKTEPPKKKLAQPDKKLKVTKQSKSSSIVLNSGSPKDSSASIAGSSKSEPEMSMINTEEFKQPPVQKLLMPTTLDKHIPCKDREYDPNRHCGCWLEEWGKHCTRSLTCKSHALSLRRKVPGRCKPFDQLLQEHREAKEALQLQKALENVKNSATKTQSSASKSATTKSDKSALNAAQNSKISCSQKPHEHVDTDGQTELDHTKLDTVGYSPFHPRPLAASSYGARLSGLAYVPNRQLDFLRMALTCAIEQPRQISKKMCASKTSRPVNGSHSSSTLTTISSSLAMLQKAQLEKKNLEKLKMADKKKKAKRPSQDSVSSNKITSPVLSPEYYSLPNDSVLSLSNKAKLTSNGASQLHQSKMLQELAIVSPLSKHAHPVSTKQVASSPVALIQSLTGHQEAGNEKTNGPTTTSKVDNQKCKQKASTIQLTTTSAGIGSLTKHNMAMLDGLPYTIVSSNIPTTSKVDTNQPNNTRQPLLLKSADKLATNGMVITNAADSQNLLESQTALVELVPQHKQVANIQYVKSESVNGSDNQLTQNASNSDKISRFTFTNGSTIALNSQVLAMQLNKQAKPNVSLTIPLSTQTSHAQQPTILHNTTTAAHPGYS